MSERQVLAGRYELLEEVGRGGMGCVWRGYDHLLNREVAIKEMYPPSHLNDTERGKVYERVEREARYAGSIDHPSLIAVYDVVVSDDGRPWIVMQYLPLLSLQQYVQQKKTLSTPEVIKIARNLFDALRAVHARGIIHRDIKPGNMLVRPDGTIVLLDFGIAKRSQDTALTGTGMMIGSPPFMAPECFKHEAEVGFAADLWAVGLVLYFALTGTSLFQRDTNEATWYAIVHEEVPLGVIKGPLAELVAGLLEKDAAKRLSLDMASRLLEAPIRETELRTETTVRPVVATHGRKKSRRPALLAGLSVVVVGTFVVSVVMNGDDDKSLTPKPTRSSTTSTPGLAVPRASASATSSPSPEVSTSQVVRPHNIVPVGDKRYYQDIDMSIELPDGWKVLEPTSAHAQFEAPNGDIFSAHVLGIGDIKEVAERRYSGTSDTKEDIVYGGDDYAVWDFTAIAYCDSFCPPGSQNVFSTQIKRKENGKLIEVTVKQNTILPKGMKDDSDKRRVDLAQFSNRVALRR